MLPMLVSSAHRLPWPSCSMPSLVRSGKNDLLERRGTKSENIQARIKNTDSQSSSTNTAGEELTF